MGKNQEKEISDISGRNDSDTLMYFDKQAITLYIHT